MKRFAALIALAAAVPANADIVNLTFAGVIPNVNAFFGSGPDTDFTEFQKSYFYTMNFGSPYSFTLSYDTAAAAVGGKFPVTFSQMSFNGVAMPAGFTPYISFAAAGSYTYMNITLEFDEIAGNTNYRSYAFISIGDNDGDIIANKLPNITTPSVYDAINVSFEIYGRNQSYRTLVDSQSRGLTVGTPPPTPPATPAVPEPASWALMIGGFAAAGAMLRGRRRPLAAFA